MYTNPITPKTGGQEQNEKIYIINRHFWADSTPKQVVARTAKTEDEANKIISEYRQENKKLLAEARHKGINTLKMFILIQPFQLALATK